MKNKDEKKKVPMYDPYTGEPNPDYEKLTGEKNPLEIVRNTGKGMFLVPPNFEFKKKNLFLVIFPENYKIEPFFVRSVKLPTTKTVTLPIIGPVRVNNSETEIILNETIDNQIVKKLFETQKSLTKFDFFIEQLDPTGVIIQKFNFNGCFINSIDFGELTYASDELYEIKISISSDLFKIK